MGGIGILTFHNNANKGAMLQAYCLKAAIQERYDSDVTVVPYRTAAKERQERLRQFVTTRPRRIPWRVADRRRCEAFVDDHLLDDTLVDDTPADGSLFDGTGRLVTDDYDEAVDWIDAQDYDVVITGSDEVWKVPEPDGGLRGALFPSRPYPNLYFLGDAVRSRTVAYAGSANTLQLSELDAAQRRRLRADLQSIDHVSVRDDHTERVLGELGVRDVRRAPDPTMLVEIPTRPVESVLRENGIDPDRPILGLHGEDSALFEGLVEHYRDRGYQVVSTMGSRFADLRLRGRVDPFQYYAVYDHFDFVVTSSLHSTIFSLHHGTPFATVDTAPIYRSVQSKTHSLLSEFGLLERHVDATELDASDGAKTTGSSADTTGSSADTTGSHADTTGSHAGLDDLLETVSDLERPIDESHVSAQIETLRDRGYEFLDEALREHVQVH